MCVCVCVCARTCVCVCERDEVNQLWLIPYPIEGSWLLEHIREESQRDDAFHYSRYTVVESTTTDSQPGSKNWIPDSIRQFHPPKSHSGSKDFGKCAIRYNISLVTRIRSSMENQSSSIYRNNIKNAFTGLLLVKLIETCWRVISKVEQIVDVVSDHQQVVFTSNLY